MEGAVGAWNQLSMGNADGEEQALKAREFVLVNPDEKHHYCNKGNKPFKMICGVPKEFEQELC